jgi:hypothetical protein
MTDPVPRETAARRLRESLEAGGCRSGRIDLPVIWPAVAAWWRTPITGVAPEDDWRTVYISEKPVDADPSQITVFAGHPPDAIADRDLLRLDFERSFQDRAGGGAGLTLWYEASAGWDSPRTRPGWDEAGVSTPNVDWSSFSYDGDIERFIAELEQDELFAIASAERALALYFSDDRGDEELDVLARP